MPSTSKAALKKRQSDADVDDDYAESAPKPKKPRTSTTSKSKDPHEQAKTIVKTIINSPENFQVPTAEDDIRQHLLVLAQYAVSLQSGEGVTPKQKSPEEIESAAIRLRDTVSKQIKKQMVWKPSCKVGTAKWQYEGICSDPAVFQRLMRLPAPATYKQTKITVDDLTNILDDNLVTSVRYDYLYITGGEVNVRWNKETGEFRFSGTYGKKS
ncbi:hypothetical protein FRC03_005934 [Tulasnella sp. 419]|nr:hypothetical protein FRC02_010848 [Tulasnella sp. 418]KAG8960951.1 hypothetical protein FRC03_005934 [Tulasnella sp. 419]